MPPAFRRLVPVATVGAAIALAVGGACSRGPRDGLEADEARFRFGERSATVPLTACGRDGDVVALAGAGGGVVLQAWADLGEGGTARTGVTADLGGEGILGAFGPGMHEGPAGEVAAVRVDGDRLVVEGTWVPLDDRLAPVPGATAEAVEGDLVARCPAPEDESAGGRVPGWWIGRSAYAPAGG
ncbi:MAG TPA: hypothetical protein VFZ77_25015 [Acidimicrobiales bacterium]